MLVSNFPFRYDLNGTSFVRGGLLEGLKIPGLDGQTQFRPPRGLSELRAQHADVIRFVETLLTMQIPSTLDGELPSRAFEGPVEQLRIGERYLIQDKDGRNVAGELLQGLVLEQEMRIAGLFRLEDGSTIMCQIPLTEAALKVYHESPTTFFGIDEPKKRIGDPGELYEWFLSAYKQTPRDRLLELLGGPDIESLRDLPQLELARVYSDRAACSVLAMQRPAVPGVSLGVSPINAGGTKLR